MFRRVGTSPNATEEPDSQPASEGVSAFFARVLDQLSLSAWFPAALLTASGALLIQFRRQGSIDIWQALSSITGDKLRLLLLAVPTLLLGTLITQAFSFEAIRTLEGYWRRRGLAAWTARWMIKRHVSKKSALDLKRSAAAQKAFAVARPRLLAKHSHAIVNALEMQMLEYDEPELSPEDEEKFRQMNWRSRCDAWDLARVDALAQQAKDYPITSRVLPTKLGNVIRATEDSLKHAGQDVEGFALRRRSTVSRRVQTQHDQFRTRLDMYCTLVFASALLCALTVGLLVGQVAWTAVTGLFLCFAALAIASYGAAIASARGYGTALKQMDDSQ